MKFLREIDLAIPRVFRPSEASARNMQTEPLAMLNVDSHGNVSSFSPELLGLKNAAYGDLPAGQHQHPVAGADLPGLPRQRAASRHPGRRRGVRATCEYFSVCGGGAPVNKLFENGSFASTRTSYCTLTQIVPTDLILEAYDRLEQSWVDGGTSAIAELKSPLTPAAEAVASSPR